MVRVVFNKTAVIAVAGLFTVAGVVSHARRQQVLTVDHYVRVRSSAPAMAGQVSQIYVRERTSSGTVLRVAALGAPRAGGYTSRHAGKVDRLVLLAPSYDRAASSTPPAKLPADGVAFNTQSRNDFFGTKTGTVRLGY